MAAQSIVPAPARPSAAAGADEHPEPVARPPNLLQHFYHSGIACLVRGDPAGAAEVFEVTDQIAADLPQMHYLLALARLLADFDHRAQALPPIERALAEETEHPLYAIVDVLADARLSTLKPDGALYLTPAGARLLSGAGSRLPAAREAYNGKYLAVVLGAIEATGDAALPQRLNGFQAMLGPGRKLSLPEIKEPQALGRLLVLAIPENELARYEARFLDSAAGGHDVAGFTGAQRRRSELRPRSVLSP